MASNIARCLLVIAAVLLGASPTYAADGDVASAKALFNRYMALERAFDAGVADLYADTAVIRNKRTYPTGQVREMTLPATQYKSLIRASMPLAASRGDVSTYSKITYTPEGARVRVVATRYSGLKKYYSPFSLLVGPSEHGTWLIYEELSESQP